MSSAESKLPYWQVNVAPSERADDCPDFLVNLTDKDRGIVGTPDAHYRINTWAEVRQRVADNRLDLFQRAPSQLRRYLEFCWGLRQSHGNVINFVLRERLGWTTPVMPEGPAPFVCDEDVKILRNDWPYGIDERIIHLVVWTKFALEEDPDSGHLTERTRNQVDDFVTQVFGTRVPSDHVCRWFLLAVQDHADVVLGHLVQELGIAEVGQGC